MSDSRDSAIGQANPSLTENTSPALISEMLQGQWHGSCDVDDDGTGIGSAADYTGSEYTVWGCFYDDANCSYLMFEAGILGNYTIGESSIASNGTAVTELNAIGHTLLMKPSDFDFSEYLNEIAMCGYTGWRSGEFQVVTKCPAFSDTLINYDIVQFDGSVHYLGENTESLDGQSKSNRPQNINYSVVYSRFYNDESTQLEDGPSGKSRGTDKSTLNYFLRILESYGLNIENM